MTQRDRAAVDVHFFRIEIQFPRDRDGLNCESFIQFDQIDVVQRPSGFRQQLS